MARIRTIKPEFWTSAQVLECSRNARLLFIGILNFADDHGRHPYSAKQCKAEVFPADDLSLNDVLRMLSELSQNGLIAPYTVDGKEYFIITGWHHQRIDKPQKAKYPSPEEDPSKNIPRTFPPDRKGKEGIGKEEEGDQEDCPHKDIVALYHATLPNLRAVRAWTPARQEMLRARWKEDAERQNLDWWKEFFQRVAGSDFLTGKSTGDRPFEADMEWLVRPQNFVKVIEGKYDNKKKADPYATANRV
jgi:hypothetical protein